MGNPRKDFLKVGIRWSTMRNCEDIARLVMKKEGVQHELISGREKKR